jgi:hypothetical protein
MNGIRGCIGWLWGRHGDRYRGCAGPHMLAGRRRPWLAELQIFVMQKQIIDFLRLVQHFHF